MAYRDEQPSSPEYAAGTSGRRYIASSGDDTDTASRARQASSAGAGSSRLPTGLAQLAAQNTLQAQAPGKGAAANPYASEDEDPFGVMANEAVGFINEHSLQPRPGAPPPVQPAGPPAPLPAPAPGRGAPAAGPLPPAGPPAAGPVAPVQPGPPPAAAAAAAAAPAAPAPAPTGPTAPPPAQAAPAGAAAAPQAPPLAPGAAAPAARPPSAPAPPAAATGAAAPGKRPLTEKDRRRKRMIALNAAARQAQTGVEWEDDDDDDDAAVGAPQPAAPLAPAGAPAAIKARASAGAAQAPAAPAAAAAKAPRPKSAGSGRRGPSRLFGGGDPVSSSDESRPLEAGTVGENLALKPPLHDQAFDGRNEYIRMQCSTKDLKADTDDLRAKVAYEQLNTLTDMSRRLQEEIENSKAIFLRRVRAAEMALVGRAFKGWKQLWLDANTDLHKLERAIQKLTRFTLTKAWLKWREVTKQRGLGSWMVNKIRAVNRAGRRRRAFFAWREVTASTRRLLVNERNKLAVRMEVIEQCKANAIRLYMNRQRLKALREAWDAFDTGRDRRERKRQRLRKFIMMGLHGTYTRCFARWKELHAELVRVRQVMVKILKSKMARAFNTWFGDVVAPRRRRRVMLARVIGKALHRRQAAAWESWREWVADARADREALYRSLKHWTNRALSSAMEKWFDACRFARVAKRALMKMYLRAVSRAWEQWWAAIELQQFERTQEGHDAMRGELDRLRRENDRLRRDNERFVRLIDSGQWSRARVDEISKAGLTLQQERAELARLIYALNAGNREWLTPMERNKMLLKGASSLNAVDRAIKADILESGKGVANPDLLYAIDKLSLQKVSVKAPDGSLKVEAVHGALPPFARAQLQEMRSAALHSPLRPSSARSARDPLRSLTGGGGAPDSARHPHYPHYPQEHPPQTPPSAKLTAPKLRPASAAPRVAAAAPAAPAPAAPAPAAAAAAPAAPPAAAAAAAGGRGVTFPALDSAAGAAQHPPAAPGQGAAGAAAPPQPTKQQAAAGTGPAAARDAGATAGPSAATSAAAGGTTLPPVPPPKASGSGKGSLGAGAMPAPAVGAATSADPKAPAGGAAIGATGGAAPQAPAAGATPAGAAAPGPQAQAAPAPAPAATGAAGGTAAGGGPLPSAAPLPPIARRPGSGGGREPARDAGVASSQ